MDLQAIAQQKILILDGAMGTMIQRCSFSEEDFRDARFADHGSDLQGNNDLLSITQPEAIYNIHLAYLKAGADIIETNTFNSTSISQADYGLESLAYELNVQSAKLAKKAAVEMSTTDWPRFVAGAMGPTNRTASLSPDVNRPGFRAITFETLKDAYRTQADGLIDGGVDALLVETVFDTLNAKAALMAIEEAFDARGKRIPVMVSGTITDASGRTLSGQTAHAFLISIAHFELFSVGFNCALGADQLEQHIHTLSRYANTAVSAHPNAGLPNEMGAYDQDPAAFCDLITSYFERSLVNIIGGCCGTTPEHIQALAESAAKYTTRTIPKTSAIA